MTAFPLDDVADMLGVSLATARRWTQTGRLPSTVDSRGKRVVEASVLVPFAKWLAQNPPEERGGGESARNRFEGHVTHVPRDTVMAQVEMRVGTQRIVSLMSREAADELGLEPGMRAVASFKSTNVIVEIPESP